MSNEIVNAAQRLQARFPRASVRIEDHDSVVSQIHILLDGKTYVVEHHGPMQYSADRITPETVFMRGTDNSFTTLSEAVQFVIRSLEAV